MRTATHDDVVGTFPGIQKDAILEILATNVDNGEPEIPPGHPIELPPEQEPPDIPPGGPLEEPAPSPETPSEAPIEIPPGPNEAGYCCLCVPNNRRIDFMLTGCNSSMRPASMRGISIRTDIPYTAHRLTKKQAGDIEFRLRS